MEAGAATCCLWRVATARTWAHVPLADLANDTFQRYIALGTNQDHALSDLHGQPLLGTPSSDTASCWPRLYCLDEQRRVIVKLVVSIQASLALVKSSSIGGGRDGNHARSTSYQIGFFYLMTVLFSGNQNAGIFVAAGYSYTRSPAIDDEDPNFRSK